MYFKKALLIFLLLLFMLVNISGQSVNESGAFTYSYPIEIPPGTNGMQPNISLNYNSQGGNSPIGLGWNFSFSSQITVDTDYTNRSSKVHFVLDGQKLIPDLTNPKNFKTESDQYLHVEAQADYEGTRYWIVTHKNGSQYIYGDIDNNPSARIGSDKCDQDGIIWALSKVIDINGNYYKIEYLLLIPALFSVQKPKYFSFV
ncbi:MAG: hypothetical protein GY756_17725 [bacterium]|nr:hypothetical protein [bacterium]